MRTIYFLPLLLAVTANARPYRPAGVNLPLEAPRTGSYEIVRAYAGISLTRPLLVLPYPGENKLIALEQGGLIKTFDNNNTARTTQPFLDATRIVNTGGNEMGLLGFAFSPDFATTREFYIAYTDVNPRRLVVARGNVRPGTFEADSRTLETVIEVPKNQDQTNHNGGMIAFGPDRLLYIGTGDGGGAGDRPNNAQTKTQLLGKVLRIDPLSARPYAIPATNPFVNNPEYNPRIFALGIRNPWRFSFDSLTGKLWLADVGQGEWEEINIIEAGGNYGWKVFEGRHPFQNPQNLPLSDFKSPLFEYDHTHGISITGGYVYRGRAFPELSGTYIYGDYDSGHVWSLVSDGIRVERNDFLADVPGKELTSFGLDPQGELLLISRPGRIFRLARSRPNNSVIAEKLSETGIFTSVRNMELKEGFEEYSVNSPLWSDGALKRRWIGLPATGTIDFDPEKPWTFPDGSTLVKHFELALGNGTSRRLETRVLFKHREGWRGYTYKWNSEQTEATLLTGAETETYRLANGTSQTWYYPSRNDCLSCHASSVGEVLGVNTPQLNGSFHNENQLARMNRESIFNERLNEASTYKKMADPYNPAEPLAARARSYLAANCVQCHNPDGTAPGGMNMQLAASEAQMNLIDVRQSEGELAADYRIRRGHPEQSVLLMRMESLDPQHRMPPLATRIIDRPAVEMIRAWIQSM